MRPRRDVFWLALYGLLSVLLLWPLSSHPSTHLPDDGDAVLGNWVIWWGATHLARGYPAIFDANSFYPHPEALLYTEPMLGEALVAWPLFEGLDNPVLAMNLLTLATLAASAFAAHLLFRELTGSDAGAFVGAFFFTFNSFTFSQLARIQLVTLQWMALGLFCLHRYFTRGGRRYLAGFALFSILQGLCCFYYLLFYLVALAILFPVYFWRSEKWRSVRSFVEVGGSGLLVGAVLAMVAVPMLLLYHHYGFEASPESFDLASYFLPRSGNWLASALGTAPQLVDHFLGYSALGLAALGAVFWIRERKQHRAYALAYLAVGVSAFFLSAGPELTVSGTRFGPGPFAVLQLAGPFENLRAPERFAILVFLCLGLFVARATDELWTRCGGGLRGALVCIAIVGVFTAEHRSSRRVVGREIPTGETIPEAYRFLAERGASGALAELPVRPFREMRLVTLDALFSTVHGMDTLFNKTSFYPPATELLQWELATFPDRKSLTLLQSIGVTTGVVHPLRWGEGASSASKLRAIARRLPELELVAEFPLRDDPLSRRYELGGERVFRIPPLEVVPTARECACLEIPRDGFRVDASGMSDPELAIDGLSETRWTSGATQVKGDFFEIAFDRPRRPARIEIEMSFPWGEFPRHLEVNGFQGPRAHRFAQLDDIGHKVALVRQLVEDPSKARMRFDLQPMTVDRIRLFIQVTEEGSQPWSMSEIRVYELEDPDAAWGE